MKMLAPLIPLLLSACSTTGGIYYENLGPGRWGTFDPTAMKLFFEQDSGSVRVSERGIDFDWVPVEMENLVDEHSPAFQFRVNGKWFRAAIESGFLISFVNPRSELMNYSSYRMYPSSEGRGYFTRLTFDGAMSFDNMLLAADEKNFSLVWKDFDLIIGRDILFQLSTEFNFSQRKISFDRPENSKKPKVSITVFQRNVAREIRNNWPHAKHLESADYFFTSGKIDSSECLYMAIDTGMLLKGSPLSLPSVTDSKKSVSVSLDEKVFSVVPHSFPTALNHGDESPCAILGVGLLFSQGIFILNPSQGWAGWR